MKKLLITLMALTMVASLAACGNTTSGTASSSSTSSSSSAAQSSSAAESGSASSSATTSTPATSTADVPDPGVDYDDVVQFQVMDTEGQHNMLSEDDAQYVTGFVQDYYLKDDAVVAAVNDVTVTDEAAQDDTVMKQLEDNLVGTVDGTLLLVNGTHFYVAYNDLSEVQGLNRDTLISTVESWGLTQIAQ